MPGGTVSMVSHSIFTCLSACLSAKNCMGQKCWEHLVLTFLRKEPLLNGYFKGNRQAGSMLRARRPSCKDLRAEPNALRGVATCCPM